MNTLKLIFVHVSENAFFSQEGKLSVIGIFDKIFSNNFPALHPAFAISLGVTGERGSHKMQIDIISPQGQPIIPRIEKTIEIAQGGGANFVANLVGLVFQDPGKYVIRISLDDDQLIDESGYLILGKATHV